MFTSDVVSRRAPKEPLAKYVARAMPAEVCQRIAHVMEVRRAAVLQYSREGYDCSPNLTVDEFQLAKMVASSASCSFEEASRFVRGMKQ